jgi:hypothetical protein
VAFDGSGHIRGMAFDGSGHIRGVAFDGSDHIRGMVFDGKITSELSSSRKAIPLIRPDFHTRRGGLRRGHAYYEI